MEWVEAEGTGCGWRKREGCDWMERECGAGGQEYWWRERGGGLGGIRRNGVWVELEEGGVTGWRGNKVQVEETGRGVAGVGVGMSRWCEWIKKERGH